MNNFDLDEQNSFLDIYIIKMKIFEKENIPEVFNLSFEINGNVVEAKNILLNEKNKEINVKMKIKEEDLNTSMPINIKCYEKSWLLFNREIASTKFLFNLNCSSNFRQWFYLKNLNEENILSLLISIKFLTNKKIIPSIIDEIRLEDIITLISEKNKKIIECENKFKKRNLNANLIMNNYFENIKKLEKQRRKFEDNIKEFNQSYFKIENKEREFNKRKRIYMNNLLKEELENEIIKNSNENFQNLNFITMNINYNNPTEEMKKNYNEKNKNYIINNKILFRNLTNKDFEKEIKLSLNSKESFKKKFSTSTNLTSKNNSEVSFSGIISPLFKEENKKIKIVSYEYQKIRNKTPKNKKEKVNSKSNIMNVNIINNFNLKCLNKDNNSLSKKERRKKENTISLNSYKSIYTNIPIKPIHSFFNFNNGNNLFKNFSHNKNKNL